MLFALYDYFQFRNRSGRYAKNVNQSGSLMGVAFDGQLPDEALSKLKPGDIICIQNFDWYVSWLIIFMTYSSISHVAFYLGNRTVGHMTLDGLMKVPIKELYKPTVRILPFVWFLPSEARERIEPTLDLMKDKIYYDKILLLRKGLKIASGRDWTLYRAAFFIDISIVLLLLDVLAFTFTKFPVFSFLIPAYLAILIINRARYHKNPITVEYPERFVNALFRTGRGVPIISFITEAEPKKTRCFGNDTDGTQQDSR